MKFMLSALSIASHRAHCGIARTHATPRPALRVVMLIAVCLSLANCGDNESEQREAFSAFLRSRIIEQKGLHVPIPTDQERRSFGVYATHYDVILDFQTNVSAILNRPAIKKKLNISHAIADLLAHRDDMRTQAAEFKKSADDVKTLLAATNTKKTSLSQPADLQAVFTAAYQRTVVAPAEAVIATTPSAVNSINADLALADYIAAHPAKIQFSGASVKPADKQTADELRALLETSRQKGELSKSDQRVLEAATGR